PWRLGLWALAPWPLGVGPLVLGRWPLGPWALVLGRWPLGPCPLLVTRTAARRCPRGWPRGSTRASGLSTTADSDRARPYRYRAPAVAVRASSFRSSSRRNACSANAASWGKGLRHQGQVACQTADAKSPTKRRPRCKRVQANAMIRDAPPSGKHSPPSRVVA